MTAEEKKVGLSRLAKDLAMKEMSRDVKEASFFVLMQHSALSSSSINTLRGKLRPIQARYLVIKNSLGRRVFNDAKLKDMASAVDGSCGIAFAEGDPVLSSKAIVDFAKENESLKIIKGFMDGAIVGADQIKRLASLPSREVLLTQMVVGMKAPITQFVGVLSGTVKKLVGVLDAIAKKKGS